MIFRKGRKEVKKWVRKMDGIVTGLIIGGAAASIFGLSRTPKWKKITGRLFDLWKDTARYGYAFFGRSIAHTISFFFKKK